jgi:dipeptidyl aminopeptidase/acylaminoacyl peptidase
MTSPAQQPATTHLIPRQVLFGNPDKASAQLSPNGKYLSFLAPVEGVLNVWVGPAAAPDAAAPVTHDRGRGIRAYGWAYTNRHITYIQDRDGDENWHIYAVDLDSGQTRDLTPLDGVHAQIQQASPRFPHQVLIGLNHRNPQLHDIYRVNIITGERDLVQENPGFAGFLTDDDFNVRFAVRLTPDGGSEILRPKDAGQWETYLQVGMEDTLTTSPLGFDKSGEVMYLLDSRGRNTSALTALDLNTGVQTLLAEDPRSDVSGTLVHPTEKSIQAVAFTYHRKEWRVLDDSIAPDLEFLRTVAPGDMEVTSRTLDDRHWIVAFLLDDGPVRYYHYQRNSREARFLFTNRRALEGLPLARMHPASIISRDGLDLVSYYTLPRDSDPDGDGLPDHPRPTVLLVHGGPWHRDTWGYDPFHQLLANRGYAVLSVNFRGSTGLGKDFINAGNLEWGGKMHDDLIDAVNWAVEQGIADPDRVAIMGGSYGGYAALVGLTFTPDVFACGVAIVGPSSLLTLVNSIPEYWQPQIVLFTTRMGDHRTEEGRDFLTRRSPLTYVERISKPLLIGQGANDPRVKQAESDQIVRAMQGKDIPVTYVLYPDEGHGFARPENALSFMAVSEAFLSACLGGRHEPIGEDFSGSSITVPQGREHVPGLAEALS